MKKKNNLYKTTYLSSVGKLTIVSDKNNIIGLFIDKQKYFLESITEDLIEDDNLEIFLKTKKWLDSYFKGEKPSLKDIPLKPRGTDFRKIVWSYLLEIPYGKTTTYKEITEKVKKKLNKDKMSPQAVGMAIGHNPISILIPCHRVISVDGKLTGYAGGIDIKKKLLELEQINR